MQVRSIINRLALNKEYDFCVGSRWKSGERVTMLR